MKKSDILNEAQLLTPELIKFRRELHAHPGTGFDIECSFQHVKKELDTLGIQATQCGKAGWTAVIGTGKAPVFLIRGDMDGLPIVEATDLEFKSKNNNMHACGHDIHTTMLLGAAKILKKHEKDINGTVKLMFQPAEEIMEGSMDMIHNGVLTNPKVDAAMMIHVLPAMPIDDGTIVYYKPGIAMASCDWFDFHIFGKEGHGSTPSSAIDPIPAMANVITALQELQSRELSVDQPISLTFGVVEGGTTNNVIPGLVSLKGTLRTRDEALRITLKKRIEDIVSSVTATYRCKSEVIWGAGCPIFINDKELSDNTPDFLCDYLPKEKLVFTGNMNLPTIMASEDFSYISHEVPTALFNIAAADSRLSAPYPVHHPKLVLNDSIIPYGITTFVGMSFEYINSYQK